MAETALIVLAEPSGGDDAAGRVFNALAAAKDFRSRGDDLSVVFQGAGTRWPSLLAEPNHPFNGLFTSVRSSIAGVSDACSVVFGAQAAATDAGFGPVGGNPVDGAGELASSCVLASNGYRILTF